MTFLVVGLCFCPGEASDDVYPNEKGDQKVKVASGQALHIAGDLEAAQRQLCELLDESRCGSRLRYNPETGAMTIDVTGIDMSKNEGALLLRQIVDSEHVYNLILGNQYPSAAGWKSLGNEAIVNNSNTFDPRRFRIDKPAGVRPPAGSDSVVAIDPANARFRDSEGRKVPLSAVVFHELVEAYSKVDLGKPYLDFELAAVANGTVVATTPVEFQRGAHNDAVQREIRLRSQRPDLRGTGRAGDVLTTDPNP